MKKISCLLILAATLSSAAWAADSTCAVPRTPGKLPDGKTATKEEMATAQKVVKQYDATMNEYLACIKTEHEAELAKDPAATEAAKKRIVERYTKKNDAAVDEVQEYAGRFNEQVRVFKARTAK